MINLKGAPINNHTDLRLRIMHLSAEKEEQENVIKRNVKELYYSIHPAHMLKEAIHDLTKDEGLKGDAKKLGLELGTDFIARKFFGRKLTLKSYLSSVVLNRLAGHLLEEYKEVISGGIQRIRSVFGRTQQKTGG
jgi:hypothetical protein